MKEKDIQYIFQRKEKKYLMNRHQVESFKKIIIKYMQQDKYGLHTICSIYYDTDDFQLSRRSIEKPIYKEKLRVRSYGIPKDEDKVFLEIKKKYKGIVYKRRESLNLKQARAYLNHGVKPSKDSQILREIDYLKNFYGVVPKVFLAYDREAFFGRENRDIRITFDRNIRSRDYNLDLALGDYGELLLADDIYVVEIKVPEAMPLWLSEILSQLEIYPQSFSKYGNAYKKIFLATGGKEICSQIS